MLTIQKRLVYLLLVMLFFSSCEVVTYRTAPKVFPSDGSPAFVQNISGDYYLCKPWSYDNPANATAQYPLFVYLHGSGGDGAPGSLPCLTNDTDKKTYPCFVYLPHAPGSWDDSKLISQMQALIAANRIDTNRIYLMGYSMGGSGSYALANDYYDAHYRLFAGIVRMAGQSQTTVRTAIANRTSIWYHVGLSDDPLRVSVAQSAYQFLKSYSGNVAATESSKPVVLSAYPGTTRTLTKAGIEIVKYTEYNAPVGHGISNFPLQDPYLLQWLFSQSISKR